MNWDSPLRQWSSLFVPEALAKSRHTPAIGFEAKARWV
jgi:hypothetical protein